ncbi:MAG TPA: hypothetical protein VGH51_06585 [Candidatus Angelobacter sp.]|jgi:hypothetical protein
MPFTFNGIGTTFYGARDFALDGTYTTTEWFTFVYIPVIPLRSLRIRDVKGGKNFVVYASQQYAVYSKGRPNLKQVLSIYGWCAAIVACISLASVPGIGKVPFRPLIAVLAVAFLPWILRRRARRRLLAQVQAGFPNFQPGPGSTAGSSSFQSPPGPEAWSSNFKPGPNSKVRFSGLAPDLEATLSSFFRSEKGQAALSDLMSKPDSEEFKVLLRARNEGWDSERTQREMAKVVAQGKPK